MATRKVIARFGFNGINKGHTFEYDPETDHNIAPYIEAGFLAHVDDDEPVTPFEPYRVMPPLGFGFTVPVDVEMTAEPIANARRTKAK